jgi:hypothetical protein
MAAISHARPGETVIICEKMPQLGKKLLATGNGRCNLLNDELSEVYYNQSARKMVGSIFSRYGSLKSGLFPGDRPADVFAGRTAFSYHKSGCHILRFWKWS